MEDEFNQIWEYLKSVPMLIDNTINHELYFMTPYWDHDFGTKYVFSSQLTDTPKTWAIHVMDTQVEGSEACLTYDATLDQIKTFIGLIQNFK